jgi:hypothetical protein
MDVSEIGCTIFDRVDPKAAVELSAKGRELWSYLCTGPKSPWVTLFIDHPAVNLRIWPWMSYKWGLRGLLVWRANYWTSSALFPRRAVSSPRVASLPLPKTMRVGKKKLKLSIPVLLDLRCQSLVEPAGCIHSHGTGSALTTVARMACSSK